MRVFLLLTLAAAVSAELCKTDKKGAKDDQKNIAKIKGIVRTAATMLIGESCPSLNNNIDKVFFMGECRNLAKQSMCFGMRIGERYEGVSTISYGFLAGGIDNIAEMGNLACDEGVACFKQITKAVKKCMKKNPNFVDETIEAAEMAYRANAEAQVREFVDSQANTLFGELAEMAMSEFGSAADIKSFVDRYVSSKLKDQVQTDAELAAKEVAKLARGFCNSGCVDKTATFVKGLFGAMHGGQCMDATQFCGPCQENAHGYLQENSMPCCLNKLVRKGIEAYDYVAESYGDKIDEWAGLVSAELSDRANERAAEIRDEVLRQAECIGQAYKEHRPSCA